MRLEELEELVKECLSDIIPNASVLISEDGEVVVYTNLTEDIDGDLIELPSEDSEFIDEEDADQLKEDEDEDEDDEDDE